MRTPELVFRGCPPRPRESRAQPAPSASRVREFLFCTKGLPLPESVPGAVLSLIAGHEGKLNNLVFSTESKTSCGASCHLKGYTRRVSAQARAREGEGGSAGVVAPEAARPIDARWVPGAPLFGLLPGPRRGRCPGSPWPFPSALAAGTRTGGSYVCSFLCCP